MTRRWLGSLVDLIALVRILAFICVVLAGIAFYVVGAL